MKPIILVGTHRSGTTWLGQMLSQHPTLAYWSEPSYVWSWGNNYKPDDLLTSADARPKVISHIHQRFNRFVDLQGKDRLFEKTPSNCLRLSFINVVYPQAKIIHIIRDGRSVFSSTQQILTGGFFRQDVLSRRLQDIVLETSPWEWPVYLSRLIELLSAKILHHPLKFWGPKPPGWRDWVKYDSPNVILAKQWVATINQALKDSESLSPGNYFRCYYEDLMRQPETILKDMFDFAELSDVDNLISDIAETVDSTRQFKWRDKVDEMTLREIRPYLESTLNSIGYSW